MAVAAVGLIDTERWQDAVDLLENASSEDLNPVDYGWILTLRALILFEQNQGDDARRAAVKALRALGGDHDDVTARAIGRAAATLLITVPRRSLGKNATEDDAFEQDRADGRKHREMLDTAVSWWQGLEIADALDKYDTITHASWGKITDLGGEISASSQNQLAGAWLSAMLAGDRARARWPLLIQAQHELQHQEVCWRDARAEEFGNSGSHPAAGGGRESSRSQDAAREVAESLDRLRRYGLQKELDVAVARLWRTGPTEPLMVNLRRAIDQPWRNTTARSKIVLMTRAGDLLDFAGAAEAVGQCLDALSDPEEFHRQITPTFSARHFLGDAVRRMLVAADTATHARVLEMALSNIPLLNAESAGEEHLLDLVRQIKPDVLGVRCEDVHRAVNATTGRRLALLLLGKLAESGDQLAQTELERRVEQGDYDAAGIIGTIAAFSPVAARKLVDHDQTACRSMLEEARRGSYGGGGIDHARNLAAMGLAFPDLADWDTVLEVVLDPQVAVVDKLGTVMLLANTTAVPEHIKTRLRIHLVEHQVIPARPVFGPPLDELTAACYRLALSVGATDATRALAQVLNWLRGSALKRRVATQIVTALAGMAVDPVVQGP
ncbi:hypothetical protein ACFQY4_26360 [Catellatospora bangladeshensis]|uniref:hypothetical protein n=1 Tax=Catellatospora bangladeshensis TaxID=310355 RepID=UPI003609602E